MSNLRLAGRQVDERPAVDRAHAEKPPLRVRDREAIGRNRAGRIAIADRPELVRIGDPRQAALRRAPRRRAARDQTEDDGTADEQEKDRRSTGRPLHARILIPVLT